MKVKLFLSSSPSGTAPPRPSCATTSPCPTSAPAAASSTTSGSAVTGCSARTRPAWTPRRGSRGARRRGRREERGHSGVDLRFSLWCAESLHQGYPLSKGKEVVVIHATFLDFFLISCTVHITYFFKGTARTPVRASPPTPPARTVAPRADSGAPGNASAPSR